MKTPEELAAEAVERLYPSLSKSIYLKRNAIHPEIISGREAQECMQARHIRIITDAVRAGRGDQADRLRRIANAASVLWEEHKEYSREKHGVEGCETRGTDSEGHEMMEALVEETLSHFQETP